MMNTNGDIKKVLYKSLKLKNLSKLNKMKYMYIYFVNISPVFILL